MIKLHRANFEMRSFLSVSTQRTRGISKKARCNLSQTPTISKTTFLEIVGV